MDDRFVVGELTHAVALVALLMVIEKMEFHGDEERILVSEALRDIANRVRHRHALVQ